MRCKANLNHCLPLSIRINSDNAKALVGRRCLIHFPESQLIQFQNGGEGAIIDMQLRSAPKARRTN